MAINCQPLALVGMDLVYTQMHMIRCNYNADDDVDNQWPAESTFMAEKILHKTNMSTFGHRSSSVEFRIESS